MPLDPSVTPGNDLLIPCSELLESLHSLACPWQHRKHVEADRFAEGPDSIVSFDGDIT